MFIYSVRNWRRGNTVHFRRARARSQAQRRLVRPRVTSHRFLRALRLSANQRRSLSTSAGLVAAHVAAGFSRRERGRARPREVFCVVA